MAAPAARLPAMADGLFLPAPLGARGGPVARPPCLADGRPRTSGARCLANRGHHRQPEHPDSGSKRGCKGYDAGKKITGRKRHILTDTDGRLLTVEVHGADIQDRNGAKSLLKRSRAGHPVRGTPCAVPLHRACLRGWWICRETRPVGEGQRQRDHRGRPAITLHDRLCRPPPQMGRRANLRVDHEMPTPCARLRATPVCVAETLITIAAIATLVRRWP